MNNHGKPDLIDKLLGRVGQEAEIERLQMWIRIHRALNVALLFAAIIFALVAL